MANTHFRVEAPTERRDTQHHPRQDRLMRLLQATTQHQPARQNAPANPLPDDGSGTNSTGLEHEFLAEQKKEDIMKNNILVDLSVGPQPYLSIISPSQTESAFRVIVQHADGSDLVDVSIEDPLDRMSLVHATAAALVQCDKFGVGVDGQPYLWFGNAWKSARTWLETIATSMHGLLRTGAVNTGSGSKGFYGAVLPAFRAAGRQELTLTAFGKCSGIPLLDAVIDVTEDGKLVTMPHRPEHGNLRHLPVLAADVMSRFVDDELGLREETLLKKFLCKAFTPDQLALVQRWFGLHFVVERVGNPEKLLYLYGDGGNGKGVVQNLLTALVTPDAVANVKLQDLRQSAAVELLAGKVAMIASEAKPETNSDTLKTLVSWESLTVNPKYRDPYRLTPHCLVTQSSNVEPRFDDESEAMQRRVIALRMGHTAREGERIPHLAERVREDEYEDLVVFALKGAIEVLAARRFEVPASIQAHTASVVRKTKPIDGFIELLEFGDVEIAELELYAAYKKFCKVQHTTPQPLPEFRKELLTRLERGEYEVERRERALHYMPQTYVNDLGERVHLVPPLVGQAKFTIYLGVRVSADAEVFGGRPIGQPIPASRRQVQMFKAAA